MRRVCFRRGLRALRALRRVDRFLLVRPAAARNLGAPRPGFSGGLLAGLTRPVAFKARRVAARSR